MRRTRSAADTLPGSTFVGLMLQDRDAIVVSDASTLGSPYRQNAEEEAMKITSIRVSRACLQAAVLAALCGGLWGCNGDDNESPAPFTVEKATCGPNDRPETALQGQVPASMRAAGFQGFSCNLQLIGQGRGDGANWQTTQFKDKAGHRCAYHGTSFATANRSKLGVPVLDITNPASPTPTTYLQTTSMLDPWESLKVNERRQILAADNGHNGGGGPELDIYDVSADCRSPQLLSTLVVGPGSNNAPLPGQVGHEGAWAPDGLTYYIGDTRLVKYYAVDTSDLTKPSIISVFDPTQFGLRTHGLSISDDGNRAYFVSPGAPTNLGDLPNSTTNNGFMIVDTSEVQARKPNPQMKLITAVAIKEGSTAQHTIPVKIKGKPYIIHVDEGGAGGLSLDPTTHTANARTACAAGLSPFPMAHIIDISDELHPQIVSRARLETHDPKNCDKVLPDITGLSVFTYGSHYCSVDNRQNATTLACGYFNSGIRVFDIRDPERIKEIAYYNPAGTTTQSPGSNHIGPLVPNNWVAGGPDWCSAQVHLDTASGTLWTTCQDNGVLMLKFTNNVWPFPESSTPAGQQN